MTKPYECGFRFHCRAIFTPTTPVLHSRLQHPTFDRQPTRVVWRPTRDAPTTSHAPQRYSNAYLGTPALLPVVNMVIGRTSCEPEKGRRAR